MSVWVCEKCGSEVRENPDKDDDHYFACVKENRGRSVVSKERYEEAHVQAGEG
jgi:hypothetical protein